jgi:hypothetical protein
MFHHRTSNIFTQIFNRRKNTIQFVIIVSSLVRYSSKWHQFIKWYIIGQKMIYMVPILHHRLDNHLCDISNSSQDRRIPMWHSHLTIFIYVASIKGFITSDSILDIMYVIFVFHHRTKSCIRDTKYLSLGGFMNVTPICINKWILI